MNDLNSLVESATKSSGHLLSAKREVLSKSERIRQYLDRNPEARNKDVVDALKEFKVTPADVSNAKAQLKKKGAKQKSSGKVEAKTTVPKKPEVVLDATINLDILDAGIEFINKAGGINEAQYALNVIKRIKSL
jgi:hypothetical protein